MSWLDGVGQYAATCPFATQDGRHCVLEQGHETYHWDGAKHLSSAMWDLYVASCAAQKVKVPR